VATYAIGDIQGCFDALIQLLDKAGFNATRDRLWLVGDLVNRGPQSLEVLRYVKSLEGAAQVVLGNHDLHLIMQAEGYGRTNKEDTLAPVLAASDRDELLNWLRSCPLFHQEDEFAMVHAGLLPQWSIARCGELAAEVHTALVATSYREFLGNMWGSEPKSWRDDLRGWERLRVIVNAMTRMRFCTPDGAMDLRAKGTPEQAPKGHLPWFALPQRASKTHTVICGHWSALGFYREANLLALDSGCLWGGALTAVRLEDRRVFQLECEPTCSINSDD
jgi:bis(5'-nucleosyl)-tetraphosphatase (symmetrical)